MKYIIVDDETVAHDIIKKYCSLLPHMQLMQDCYDAIEAIEYLNRNTVDLIFLDLNMPKLQGFEFLKTLSKPPNVIVTTAYKEYALEGYELNIIDYLLKPFSFERFLKAINKIALDTAQTTSAPQNVVSDGKSERLFLRSNHKYTQVLLENVLFVESSGNYIKFVTKEETITLRGTLSSIENHMPTDGLVQVHRSFMVVLKHIKSIEANKIVIDSYTLPIGKLFKKQVEHLLRQG